MQLFPGMALNTYKLNHNRIGWIDEVDLCCLKFTVPQPCDDFNVEIATMADLSQDERYVDPDGYDAWIEGEG